MVDVETGHVLADRYEVGRSLGRGGSGAVWSAHDRVLDRTVAVKVVPDGAAAARLAREARATAGIGVEHVVAVYDVGQEGDQHFLVMEFVDGVDLASLLAATGPLPPELVALVGRDVAHGVAAVHAADLVHRDVKPSNVLVSTSGIIKLTDLGIARRTDDDATRALTQVGTVVGTVDYLAPEQVEGGEVTAASDVYAVGLLLHAMSTGRAPFGDGPVGERVARRLAGDPAPLDASSGGLADVVRTAVARDPAARPQDGDALRRALTVLVPDDESPLRAHLAERVAAARAAGPTARPARTEAFEAVAFPSSARRPRSPVASSPSTPVPRVVRDRPMASDTVTASDADAGDMTTAIAVPQDDRVVGGGDGRRLLAPLALGLGGVIVAVGVASVLATAVGGGGTDDPSQVAALTVAGVDDHDPLGGGGEHGDEIGRVADGDPATAWDTERYNSADLGGLKAGVGFLVDLGSAREVGAVELDLGLAGADVTVVVSDERPGGDPTTGPGTVLGTAEDTDATVRVEGDAVTGRWVAVWFTTLADDGGRFRAEVAEVRVLGP